MISVFALFACLPWVITQVAGFADHAQQVLAPTKHLVVNYTNLVLDYNKPEVAEETNNLLKFLLRPDNEFQVQSISSIRVSGFGSLGQWNLVADVIKRANGLAEIHWENTKCITYKILKDLGSRDPPPKLYYNLPPHDFDTYDPYESRLASSLWSRRSPKASDTCHSIVGSRSLYSITNKIVYHGGIDTGGMDLMARILYSCPNLREMDLSLERHGCIISDDTPYSFNFGLIPGGTFPPLEVLQLRGYRFDDQPNGKHFPWPKLWEHGRPELKWPWNLFPYQLVDLIGYPILFDLGLISFDTRRVIDPPIRRPPDNLDIWLQKMDWSKLHSLSLDSPEHSALHKFIPHLTSLKHVTIIRGDACCLNDILTNTTEPLETIRLLDVSLNSFNYVLDLLERHSQTVKHLGLTDIDSYWNTRPIFPITVSFENITKLSATSQDITSLELSLGRPETKESQNTTNSTTWDAATTEALASFLQLEQLTLHFPSVDFPGEREWPYLTERGPGNEETSLISPDPLVNALSVKELFLRLRKQQLDRIQLQITPGISIQVEKPRLTELSVVCGDWDTRLVSSMAPKPRRMVARWTCTIDQDEKESCDGEEYVPDW